MKQSELHKILSAHAAWLRSEGGEMANLRGADLSGANLSRANLRGADLSGANLSKADLSRADLSRANLFEANLFGAALSVAGLRGANLSGADLFEANLSGADLSGADLSGARGVVSFGPVGLKRRICYVTTVGVQLGCFWGSPEQATAAIRAKYGEGSAYEALLLTAMRALEEQGK